MTQAQIKMYTSLVIITETIVIEQFKVVYTHKYTVRNKTIIQSIYM